MSRKQSAAMGMVLPVPLTAAVLFGASAGVVVEGTPWSSPEAKHWGLLPQDLVLHFLARPRELLDDFAQRSAYIRR